MDSLDRIESLLQNTPFLRVAVGYIRDTRAYINSLKAEIVALQSTKKINEDYLKFEAHYLKELTLLWEETKDEALRLRILEIREILFRTYYTQQFKKRSIL